MAACPWTSSVQSTPRPDNSAQLLTQWRYGSWTAVRKQTRFAGHISLHLLQCIQQQSKLFCVCVYLHVCFQVQSRYVLVYSVAQILLNHTYCTVPWSSGLVSFTPCCNLQIYTRAHTHSHTYTQSGLRGPSVSVILLPSYSLIMKTRFHPNTSLWFRRLNPVCQTESACELVCQRGPRCTQTRTNMHTHTNTQFLLQNTSTSCTYACETAVISTVHFKKKNIHILRKNFVDYLLTAESL